MGRHPRTLGRRGAALTALLHLHHAAPTDAPARVQWLSPDGTIRATGDLPVLSGTTVDRIRRGDAIGATARIATSDERRELDAKMVYDDQADTLHRRTVICARVQYGRAGPTRDSTTFARRAVRPIRSRLPRPRHLRPRARDGGMIGRRLRWTSC
jgi:hypothetical protein